MDELLAEAKRKSAEKTVVGLIQDFCEDLKLWRKHKAKFTDIELPYIVDELENDCYIVFQKLLNLGYAKDS